MKWISVKDRLPLHNQMVLVYGPYVDIDTEKYNAKKEQFEYCGLDDYDNLRFIKEEHPVTHWMSLPDPPEETL